METDILKYLISRNSRKPKCLGYSAELVPKFENWAQHVIVLKASASSHNFYFSCFWVPFYFLLQLFPSIFHEHVASYL